MSGIMSALLSSAQALRTFDKALGVVENNVSNVSTPGYARQRLQLEALPFDPLSNMPGGVLTRGTESARDQYAENAVRQRQNSTSLFEQKTFDLGRLEPIFDVSGQAGIPAAIGRLFQSFSAWSVAPNDTAARANVIEQAGGLARQFNNTSTAVMNTSEAVRQHTLSVVDNINALTSKIALLNQERSRDFRATADPSLDAALNTSLEELSQLVDFTVLRQANGAVTVLMGGQTAVVVGNSSYTIQADFSQGANTAIIRNSAGDDVTSQLSQGKLVALLNMRKTTLPSYLDKLNQLAAGLATAINGQLNAGVDNTTPAPLAGADLFTYNSAATAAATLSVTGITETQLAAALPTAPGGNGNALALANLANGPQINGLTFASYYGALASGVGEDLNSAKQSLQVNKDLLAQAKALRSDISGVNLDEEAVRLVQFQRAYQASARVVNVMTSLSETLVNLLK